MFRVKSSNIDALRRSELFDVCIIGSGPAGTVAACDLAEAGMDVLLLESGAGLAEWLIDPEIKKLAAYTVSGTANYPTTQTKARLLGGNSNFWTGRCERLHPTDFEPNPYTPKENPWPVRYPEMAPYYDRAEKTLNVRGGRRSEYAPPRDDTGNPLKPASKSVDYLKHVFADANTVVDHSPTATPTKTFRFFNIQKERLAKCKKLNNLTLVTGATVTKLEANQSGTIVKAIVSATDSTTHDARAHKFIVACGGIESPRLLLLSACDRFPKGIGNHSDMLGRGFNEHPATNFYSRFRHSLGSIIPTNKIGRSHQFYCDYRDEGLGAVLPVYRQAWILPHHVMPFRLKNVPKKVVDAFRRVVKPTLYMGVTIEQSIEDSNRITLSRKKADRFGSPIAHLHFDFSDRDLRLLERTRELCIKSLTAVGATEIFEAEVTWSRHHQSTCRMGSPEHSVVDRNLKVHDTTNLFVAGSETFVTGGAMQPCLSIVALSHRLADHLVSLRQ